MNLTSTPSKITDPRITSIEMLNYVSLTAFGSSNKYDLLFKDGQSLIHNMFLEINNKRITPESHIKDIKQKLKIKSIDLNFNKTLNKNDVLCYINNNTVNTQDDVLKMFNKEQIPSLQKINTAFIAKTASQSAKKLIAQAKAAKTVKKQMAESIKIPALITSQKSWLAKRETDVTQLITFIKNLTQSIKDLKNLAEKIGEKWFHSLPIVGLRTLSYISFVESLLYNELEDASLLKASLNNKLETLSYSENNASFTKDALNLSHVLENGKANDLKDRLISIAEGIVELTKHITTIAETIATPPAQEKLIVDLAKSFERNTRDSAKTAQTAAKFKAKKLAQNATQEAVWYSQNNTQLAQIATQISEIAQNAVQYAKLALNIAEEQGETRLTNIDIEKVQNTVNEINQVMAAVHISAQLSAQRAEQAQMAVQNKK